MVTKKTPKVVLTAVAIVIAAYILSPFPYNNVYFVT